MTRSIRTLSTLFFAALGIAFSAAPVNWLELRFGLDPDGGSGLFEVLLALAFLAFAYVLVGRRLVNRGPRSARLRQRAA
jgi:hypothetical protein